LSIVDLKEQQAALTEASEDLDLGDQQADIELILGKTILEEVRNRV
jgi:hypothetical protein